MNDNKSGRESYQRHAQSPMEELMPKRAAFIAWIKSRSIDASIEKDAWGAQIFKHSHVQSMWEGWFNAPNESVYSQQHTQAALSNEQILQIEEDAVIALIVKLQRIPSLEERHVSFARAILAASQQPAAAPAAPAKRKPPPSDQALCNDGSEPDWSAYAAAEGALAIQVQEGAAMDELASFVARRDAGAYPHHMSRLDAAWAAWQDRAALAAPSPVQPAPVADATSTEAIYQQGRAAGIEEAAKMADSVGHHWSGAPALAFFDLATSIRALAAKPSEAA